jgi:hypothetical protein
MALRLVQMRLAPETGYEPDELLKDLDIVSEWIEVDEHGTTAYVVVQSENADMLVGEFNDRFGHLQGFRLSLWEIEATLPRPKRKEDEEEEEGEEPKEENEEKKNESPPINIDELYASVTEGVDVSWT